ncbi:MAG TPA: hypothetical protein VE046_16450 [Steroidobacteraceae bacterium]|nr:hypothetical protein [Steroidobacteraceae bacterium]
MAVRIDAPQGRDDALGLAALGDQEADGLGQSGPEDRRASERRDAGHEIHRLPAVARG